MSNPPKETLDEPMSVAPAGKAPIRGSLRRLLTVVLPEVRDINAFCEDEYPETAEVLDGPLPDRISTLLRREGKTPTGRREILDNLTRTYPERVTEHRHVLVWEEIAPTLAAPMGATGSTEPSQKDSGAVAGPTGATGSIAVVQRRHVVVAVILGVLLLVGVLVYVLWPSRVKAWTARVTVGRLRPGAQVTVIIGGCLGHATAAQPDVQSPDATANEMAALVNVEVRPECDIARGSGDAVQMTIDVDGHVQAPVQAPRASLASFGAFYVPISLVPHDNARKPASVPSIPSPNPDAGLWTGLAGDVGVSNRWGSGWLDLKESTDFPAGTKLRITVGGSAQTVLVRMLRSGEDPDSPGGFLGAYPVPSNRIFELTLGLNERNIRRISVHGSPVPFGWRLGPGNGPASLSRIDAALPPNPADAGPVSTTCTRLVGSTDERPYRGFGWIDLNVPTNFPAGTMLRITVGANASKVLVRLLRRKEDPDSQGGILGAYSVPSNRIVEVTLGSRETDIVRIYVYGSRAQFGWDLGADNGHANVSRVEYCSGLVIPPNDASSPPDAAPPPPPPTPTPTNSVIPIPSPRPTPIPPPPSDACHSRCKTIVPRVFTCVKTDGGVDIQYDRPRRNEAVHAQDTLAAEDACKGLHVTIHPQ